MRLKAFQLMQIENFRDHFLGHGSVVVHSKWVKYLNSRIKMIDLSKLYALAVFDGCIGSSDATHIAMLTCRH